MISLPAAKTVFFIALALAPSNPQKIHVTSNSENYVFTHTDHGWVCDALGFPSSDWTREGDQVLEASNDPRDVPAPLQIAVSQHKWDHDSVVILENGDRIEKNEDYGLYIVNAGGANQKVYTILYNDRARAGH